LRKQRDKRKDTIDLVGDSSLVKEWFASLSIAAREGIDPTILVPGTRSNKEFLNKMREWQFEVGPLPWLEDELLVGRSIAKSPRQTLTAVGLLALVFLAGSHPGIVRRARFDKAFVAWNRLLTVFRGPRVSRASA
jgi:hypothetical protein